MIISQFDLPSNVSWIEIGEGVRVFPVYGMTGGVCGRGVRYLLKKGDGAMPESLSSDLGLPGRNEQGQKLIFRVIDHGNGWKHAALWDNCDPHSFQACIREINA